MLKINDRVRLLKSYGPYFEAGTEGVVHHIDSDGDVWVTFDTGVFNQALAGTWCVDPNEVEVI